MARRSRGILGGLISNRTMWYAIYGIAGYMAYNWWMNQPSQSITIPEPTVSAFPYR